METINKKNFGLEDRTFEFSRKVREIFKAIDSKNIHSADKNQVIRSSGSVGANFIEAKEALSRKDFLMRVKICRKEAEETRYWLRLLILSVEEAERNLLEPLIQESYELTKIFGSILNNNKGKI